MIYCMQAVLPHLKIVYVLYTGKYFRTDTVVW